MKSSLLAAIIILSAIFGNAEVAVARESGNDLGNVAFAYSDGYWDYNHRWHKWPDARSQRAWRTRQYERYNPWRNPPERNRYNRDSQPVRVDDGTRNPYRD